MIFGKEPLGYERLYDPAVDPVLFSLRVFWLDLGSRAESGAETSVCQPGFLTGPILPIYGFGAVSILLFTIQVRWSIGLIFLCGMAGATVLEYFTGWLLERLFRMRYWDYSKLPLNLNGYICLLASLSGVFSRFCWCGWCIHRWPGCPADWGRRRLRSRGGAGVRRDRRSGVCARRGDQRSAVARKTGEQQSPGDKASAFAGSLSGFRGGRLPETV